MSSLTIKMTGDSSTPIAEAVRALRQSLDGDFISEIWHDGGDTTVALLSYEKYFRRTQMYTGLTVMLTESPSAQYADIIGFGGAAGLWNISWGSNAEYAGDVIGILQSLGFRETARE